MAAANLLATLTAPSEINSLSFSPVRNLLAIAYGNKTVGIYDVNGKEIGENPISPLIGHTYAVNTCCFSSFGTMLASGATDYAVCLWDIKSGGNIASFENHTNAIRKVVFSPNSSLLASASGDQTIKVWEMSRRKLLRSLQGHDTTVNTCCFTPDSNYIVSGAFDGHIKLWQASSGRCLQTEFDCHDLGVNDCQFSPTFGSASEGNLDTNNLEQQDQLAYQENLKTINGTIHYLLATCGSDMFVKLWDVYIDRQADTYNITKRGDLSGHQSTVWCAIFSPNGKLLASGSGDRSVIIWNPLHGEALQKLTAHTSFVTSCAFSMDNSILVTGSNDRTLKIWQINIHQESNSIRSQQANDGKSKAIASLQAMTLDDTCNWLKTIGMERYEKQFRHHQISGSILPTLTSISLMRDLSIEPLGHRNQILRAIQELKDRLDNSIPDEFLCPISREVMTDPVVASDGYSYQRQAIESWLNGGNRLTSPMTNAPLNASLLIPNKTLKSLIQKHLDGDRS
ncbi:WD repeat, SAM and U-box domain-containing protein 1 [Trichoplax sp. H2]|nr:WD repeat, SAM and U-box domain-containing protein 1 [Trichoplax sp. H2]|eukprot:RDD45295.1 WD repeat, SAM and U-box domain-containing protein 1 [Trichoplax sp. H2]